MKIDDFQELRAHVKKLLLTAGYQYGHEALDNAVVGYALFRQEQLDQDSGPCGWIGVDLDATLAHYDGWVAPTHIGDPVPLMADRVRKWLAEGKEVRIFTARACKPDGIPPVEEWCLKHFGVKLRVTNRKDFKMVQLWDDRCVQVVPNTGQTASEFWS